MDGADIGIVPVIPTPFTPGQEIDTEALAGLVDFAIRAGHVAPTGTPIDFHERKAQAAPTSTPDI